MSLMMTQPEKLTCKYISTAKFFLFSKNKTRLCSVRKRQMQRLFFSNLFGIPGCLLQKPCIQRFFHIRQSHGLQFLFHDILHLFQTIIQKKMDIPAHRALWIRIFMKVKQRVLLHAVYCPVYIKEGNVLQGFCDTCPSRSSFYFDQSRCFQLWPDWPVYSPPETRWWSWIAPERYLCRRAYVQQL